MGGTSESVKKVGDLHPLDEALFKEYPAPLWESAMRLHHTLINHTTPFFGPLLYWLIRAIGGIDVVEIGIAQGYTSFFMASAVKDNNARYKANGKYVAIDIADKHPIFDPLIERGFPIEVWTINSVAVTQEMIKKTFPTGIDLVFQDGWHNTEHCFKELDIFYPHVKDKGVGYWVMHDVYSWCERFYNKLVKDPRWKLNECVRLMNNYGLAICRKMDNYDYEKIHWIDGDQPAEKGFVQ